MRQRNTFMLKRFLFVAGCWWLLTVAVKAQPASSSVADIVARSVTALGASDARAAIHSITALADCLSPTGPYQTEIYSARGDRLKFKQFRAQGKPFVAFVNGQHFWTRDESTGHANPADKALAMMIRSHEFQWIALAPLARFSHPVLQADEEFDGVACSKLRVTDELGNPATLFFRKQDSLLVGLLLADTRQQPLATVRVAFKEWTQVGKLKLPSKVVATDTAGDFTLHFKTIHLNQVDERIFEVPKKISAMHELLQLHEQQRTAHLRNNPELLVSMFADEFINLSDGRITRPSRAESLQRFRAYFARATFQEWDDVVPPVIRVAEDGSLAYVIVQKRVRLTAPDEQGKPKEEAAVFAWLETYEKRAGTWALTAMASTRAPASP